MCRQGEASQKYTLVQWWKIWSVAPFDGELFICSMFDDIKRAVACQLGRVEKYWWAAGENASALFFSIADTRCRYCLRFWCIMNLNQLSCILELGLRPYESQFGKAVRDIGLIKVEMKLRKNVSLLDSLINNWIPKSVSVMSKTR